MPNEHCCGAQAAGRNMGCGAVEVPATAGAPCPAAAELQLLTGLPVHLLSCSPAGGPYLGSLRQLGLRSNALCALPPALAAAEQLEVLDAGENEGCAHSPLVLLAACCTSRLVVFMVSD